MSCERYVSAIVDHACGAEMTGELARHLSGCEGCAARLAAERRAIASLDASIQRALDVEVSDSFARDVQSRVAAPRRSTGFFWWSVAGLGAAASLAVAALLGPSLPLQRPSHRTAVPPREISARAPAPRTQAATPMSARNASSRPRVGRGLPPAKVIVPPDRARAVSEYLRLVRDRGFEAPNLGVASKAPAGPPQDLVVEPIAIDPIVLLDVEIPARPVPTGREQQ